MALKKISITALIILAITVGFMVYDFYTRNLTGIGPAISRPPDDISKLLGNQTDFPLHLPDGFGIEVLASGLKGARDLEMYGRWIAVSQPDLGFVTLVSPTSESIQEGAFHNLENPHGIAIDPNDRRVLWVATEKEVLRFEDFRMEKGEHIADIPAGGRHRTRSLAFAPNGDLLLSVGSTCDVCQEKNPIHGSVQKVNIETGELEPFATGLRNSVFITFDDKGRLWGTEMGRDLLGDDLPPDEINLIEEGKFYGWPTCYGKNIHDTVFDPNTYIRNPCMEPFETPSFVDLQAHSAPLGLDFIPKTDAWPKDWQGDLIVAYHGSWNRAEPTGYKLVRIDFDEDGTYLGTEDFITGWLTDDGALGRPVDILVLDDGVMYVSDDKAGVIYRVTYTEK